MTWDEALNAGTDAAGGKGWNLARLARYGFKVPMGRVLAARIYKEFLEYNGLEELINKISHSIANKNPADIEDDGRLVQLREQISNGSIPSLPARELTAELQRIGLLEEPVAVRSSAIAEDSEQASFAGIHASYLQVNGPDNILQAVKDCYASLWTPQAVVYRRKMEIPTDRVAMAVVVMEMVEARAAGVGFSCDPQTGHNNVLVINANFGLGESVVNGAVEPDTYYLDGNSFEPRPRVVSKKIGKKQGIIRPGNQGNTEFVPQKNVSARQVLTDKQITGLGLLLQRVTEALGEGWRCQDVEWVFDGQQFILVQARPVTALLRSTFPILRDQPDIWSNGNYRDAVPMVLSPISRSFMQDTIDEILTASFEENGYRLPKGLQFSRFFKGRLYCNLSALQWAYFDSVGGLPRDTNFFWGGHQPEIRLKGQKPFQGVAGIKRVWRGLRSFATISAYRRKASGINDRVTQAVAGITAHAFTKLENRELIDVFADLGAITKDFTRKFSFMAATGSLPVAVLIRKLTPYFKDRALFVVNSLMVGGEAAIISADHGYRLVELAGIARNDEHAARFFGASTFFPDTWQDRLPEDSPFKRAFRDFLDAYGHRAIYELDLINPRWNEDQTYLLEIIRTNLYTSDLQIFRQGQREKYRKAWQQIEQKIPPGKHAAIQKFVKAAQTGAAIREETKSVLARIIQAYRSLALEIGGRLETCGLISEPADIFFCAWPELVAVLSGEWDGRGMEELVKARKAAKQEMESQAAPDVILGEESKATSQTATVTGNSLSGVAVAGGKASGTVRVINHPAEGRKLKPKEIMAAPSTDPGWTPLFLQAGGLIMETGGFLSHGAIVAREYGIPAVVNVPGVLGIVEDGMQVTVDGDEGKIFLLNTHC